MSTANRRVVFLDIDGVLQPHASQRRFKVNVKDEAAAYGESVGNPIYGELDPYDVCAVLLDWDPEAVAHLKDVLEKGEAEIVLSSNWRDFSEGATLRALFAIWGLDCHFKDTTEPLVGKAESIKGYISEHGDEIASYVILDDDPRIGALPNAILVRGKLSRGDADEAVGILGGKVMSERRGHG